MRAALIGCGAMARHHASAMRQAGVKLVAVADTRPTALAGFDAPGAGRYPSADALLAAEAPDLLVIATTAPSHAALTIAAAAAGVPRIYCEKPAACSLGDARAMIDACDQAGATLAINHTRRWSPAWRLVRAALAGDRLGEPVHYSVAVGGGRLGCNASHMVDLVRMLSAAEVVSVTGWLDARVTPNVRGAEFWDPGGHAVMTLSTGAVLFLDQREAVGIGLSVDLIARHGRARIQDTAGVWEFAARPPELRDAGFWTFGQPLVPVDLGLGDLTGVDPQVSAYEELLAGGPPACAGDDGYRAIEAVLAIHVSHRAGHRPLALPLAGDDLALTVNWT